MNNKRHSPLAVWGRVVIALLSVSSIGLLTYIATRPSYPDCIKLCNVQKELKTVRDENIDLRAKVVQLEEDLKNTNPPNSRHFYDCTPSKESSLWTLAIYSYTTSTISAYRCMSHKGHTSLDRLVPDNKRKKLTCTDQRGVSYPQ